jgi:hypothetical protein
VESGKIETDLDPEMSCRYLEISAIFLIPIRQIPGSYFKLRHDSFVPRSVQFIIHYHRNVWRYIVLAIESVVK